MRGKINLEDAARKAMVLDVNSRYFGLETLVLMEKRWPGCCRSDFTKIWGPEENRHRLGLRK